MSLHGASDRKAEITGKLCAHDLFIGCKPKTLKKKTGYWIVYLKCTTIFSLNYPDMNQVDSDFFPYETVTFLVDFACILEIQVTFTSLTFV